MPRQPPYQVLFTLIFLCPPYIPLTRLLYLLPFPAPTLRLKNDQMTIQMTLVMILVLFSASVSPLAFHPGLK